MTEVTDYRRLLDLRIVMDPRVCLCGHARSQHGLSRLFRDAPDGGVCGYGCQCREWAPVPEEDQ